jgi:hypothetical protein
MTALIEIVIAKFFLMSICFNGLIQGYNFNPAPSSIVEIPVIDLNFYMMSRTESDPGTVFKIKENVAFLNQEFEDIVKFEVKDVSNNQGHALLPDLHDAYFGDQEFTVDSLVEDFERKGSVNVYIFDTYMLADIEFELMGFTPILKSDFEAYESVAPSLDRIFLSYSSLDKQNTLVHEMGHFLGLDHPWEMSTIDKDQMGLGTAKKIESNHMAYGAEVSSFTEEQLKSMHDFALNYRSYLINKSIYQFEDLLVNVK